MHCQRKQCFKKLVKNLFSAFIAILFFGACTPSSDSPSSHKNQWDLSLQNDEGNWIPARIAFKGHNETQVLQIINAGDTIELQPDKVSGDTTYYRFIDYHAEIAFTPDQNNTLSGYWVNFDDDPIRKRPIKATPAEKIKNQDGTDRGLSGEWRTRVSLPNRGFDAILILEEKGDILQGTMRTRSGDYQHLEGLIEGEDFFLSTFSGNSLFYLEGKIKNDTLTGRIHGVKSSDRTIEAVRDPNFDLPDASSLTKVVNDKPFQLDLKDENGIPKKFSDLTADRVSVISIFGTWCPNCVEEVDYFNEIKDDFPEVKFLFVAFETTDDEAEQAKRVQGFKNRKNIDMTFLIGGQLGEDNVREKFPMIDHFGAYPTTFILDKKGEIVSVHTGFNGPATGLLFDQYKKEMEDLLQSLVDG